MDFERGQDAFKALKIGAKENAQVFKKFYQIQRSVHFDSGILIEDPYEVAEPREVIAIIGDLVKGKFHLDDFAIGIGDESFNDYTIKKLSLFRGKYLKYISYSTDFYRPWEINGVNEFLFLIPK